MTEVSAYMYFRLANDCKLITGVTGGIIYNFGSGKTIRLNVAQTKFLMELEQNLPIPEAIHQATMKESEAIRLIRYLTSKGYGFINTSPAFIEQFEYTKYFNIPGLIEPAVSVYTAYLNMNLQCALKCTHCTANWLSRRGCNTCLPWKLGSKNEFGGSENFFEKTIRKLGEFNCQRLFFSGGDPLLNPDLLKRLALVAYESKIKEVLVITNGSNLLDNSVIPLIENKLIHPIICMFGADEKSFGRHTNTPTLFVQIIKGLEWLKDKNHKFSMSITIYRDEMSARETFKHYRRLIKKYKTYEIYSVETCQDGYANEKFNINIISEPFLKIDEFEYRSRFHPCLGYTVAIDGGGDVFPCPHLTKELAGNLNQSMLEMIIYENLLSKYWSLTKDQIQPCSQCEERYSCNDCRASDRDIDDIRQMMYCDRARLFQSKRGVLIG
jgi:radical SAM protein with 4Fe4S-binding SPASM domain